VQNIPTSANEKGVVANGGLIKVAADIWSFWVVTTTCQLCKSTLSDQILVNVTDGQSFRFTIKIFSWFAVAWGVGGSKYFFPVEPEPALSGPDSNRLPSGNLALQSGLHTLLSGADVTVQEGGFT